MHFDLAHHRPPRPHTSVAMHDAVAISRRIETSPLRLGTLLAEHSPVDLPGTVILGDRGHLVLDGPFVAEAHAHAAWSATGRLHGVGRTERAERIDVVLSAWSGATVELRIRPQSAHPYRWGRRRLRRYFDLGHLAADHWWRVLSTETAGRDRTPSGATTAAGDRSTEAA